MREDESAECRLQTADFEIGVLIFPGTFTLSLFLLQSVFIFRCIAYIKVATHGVLIIGSTCHYLLAKQYRASKSAHHASDEAKERGQSQ
jgi:hypothetical protein